MGGRLDILAYRVDLDTYSSGTRVQIRFKGSSA